MTQLKNKVQSQISLRTRMWQTVARLTLTLVVGSVLGACTTAQTSSSTSFEDRLRHQKVEERAQRKDPPVARQFN